MGRRTKLTASQHEEIRAAGRERDFLLNRIEQNRMDGSDQAELQIRKDLRRLTWLTNAQIALRYRVTPNTIGRVLSGKPYELIRPESKAIA